MHNVSKPNSKRRWLIYLAVAAVLSIALTVVLDFFPEEEKAFRTRVRNAVETTFPQQAAEVAESFGLFHYGGEFTAASQDRAAASSVVLIHGLDDPGKVWMNLAPALFEENLNVWQMRYPNDQQIVDSARFFYDEIERLTQLRIRKISIVAHSMGGLVSREMLTNPRIAYIDKARRQQVPQVVRLIMVGTPNHGSELARFRVFGEIRDQWANWVQGRRHILRGIVDGAGEAKIDLLPESRFLTTLNQRPHPPGVNMLSIAGNVTPWDGIGIDQFLITARDRTPAAGQKMLADLESFLKSMNDGLGDGLVTVESTRLDGIDHHIVRGSHLSMIRNISTQSSRVPPAIPVIIQNLAPVISTKSIDASISEQK